MPIGEQIRLLREGNNLPLRKVAAAMDMDQSILSKIERGERKATKDQIIRIAELFDVDENALVISYLSDKIVYDLLGDDLAYEVLKVAEEKIRFQARSNGE